LQAGINANRSLLAARAEQPLGKKSNMCKPDRRRKVPSSDMVTPPPSRDAPDQARAGFFGIMR
jgi:hypothetical protein